MDIQDVRSMIKQAHLPEKTVPLCLRGDLQGEWENLERKLRDVHKKPEDRDSLADDGGASEAEAIARRMEELGAEMRDSTIEVVLRAVPRKDWQKMLAEHPPNKERDTDRVLGLNSETFFDAAIIKCWVTPELGKDEIVELLDVLTSAQFDKVQEAMWGLNRRDVDVPFSRAASRIARNSGETPKQPPASESPSSGGTGGSPKRSRNTSTKKAG